MNSLAIPVCGLKREKKSCGIAGTHMQVTVDGEEEGNITIMSTIITNITTTAMGSRRRAITIMKEKTVLITTKATAIMSIITAVLEIFPL